MAMAPIALLINPDTRNRVFLKYRKAIDFFLPVGSRRRCALVSLVNSFLRNRSEISSAPINVFFRVLRDGVSDVARVIRGNTIRDSDTTWLDLPPVEALIEPNIARLESMNLGCSSTPKVSVVIPVMNKWVYTYNCLEFISKLKDEVPFEVIVVDNGSTDETKQMLALVNDLCVIQNETNMGFVEACNMGSRTSRGEYILFLNNDAMILNGSLKNMVDLLTRDRTIGAVGAKLVYPDGKLQEAGGIVWNDAIRIAWNYGKFDNPGKHEYNYVRETDYCSGACLLVRKEAFIRAGSFDTEFAPAYFEDTNLAFALRSIGYKTVYQPKAVAVHFEGVTAGTDVRKGAKKHQSINQKKFYDRWKGVLETEHYPNGENVFLARDRSGAKKVMLYIDHEIPTFDKDAGSMITFEYLKLFLSMNLKIIFWPANLREVEPYMSIMQQRGIEVIYGYENFGKYIRRYGAFFDFAVVSRPLTAVSFIDKIKAHSSAKLLYVAHDLHFLREMRRAELEGDIRVKDLALKLKLLELSISRRSDVTLVFSDFEKKMLETEDPKLNVEVMPWIQNVSQAGASFDTRKDLMFIGSFRHLPNIDGVLWFVKEVFPKVRQHFSNVKLFIVGSDPTTEIKALSNNNDIIVTGYVPDATPYFSNSKAFIAPLLYGAGVKGKIVEAMSHGLPVITTPLGAEGLNLEHGKNALIADNPDDYIKSIVVLYTSKDLWLQISKGSFEYVKTNNSLDHAHKTFKRILAV